MKTRGSREKRKVWDKIYSERHCKSIEKKVVKQKYVQERMKSLLGDAQVRGEKERND
jgi:hypothetical protein